MQRVSLVMDLPILRCVKAEQQLLINITIVVHHGGGAVLLQQGGMSFVASVLESLHKICWETSRYQWVTDSTLLKCATVNCVSITTVRGLLTIRDADKQRKWKSSHHSIFQVYSCLKWKCFNGQIASFVCSLPLQLQWFAHHAAVT